MLGTINHGISGRVSVCKHVNGRDVEVLPEFNNLILDTLLVGLREGTATGVGSLYGGTTVNGVGSSCRVGTGTLEPAVTDTALVSPVLLSTTVSNAGLSVTYDELTDEYVYRKRARLEFAEATALRNLTELAIYSNSNGTNTPQNPIISRTLFKDVAGEPTAVTLAIGEILVIFYTLYVRVKSKVSATVVIKGVDTLVDVYGHLGTSVIGGNYANITSISWTDSNRMAPNGTQSYKYVTQLPAPTPFTPITTTGGIVEYSLPSSGQHKHIVVGNGRESTLRIPLIFCNGTYGTLLLGSHNVNCQINFTPSITKTAEEVIDFTMRHEFTRG